MSRGASRGADLMLTAMRRYAAEVLPLPTRRSPELWSVKTVYPAVRSAASAFLGRLGIRRGADSAGARRSTHSPAATVVRTVKMEWSERALGVEEGPGSDGEGKPVQPAAVFNSAPQSPIPPPPNIREACEHVLRGVVAGSDDLKSIALSELKPEEFIPSLQGIWRDVLTGEDPIEVMERYGADDHEIANLLARLTVELEEGSSPITEEGLRIYVAYIREQQQDEYEKHLKIGMEAGDLKAVAEYQALKKRRKRVAMTPRHKATEADDWVWNR